MQNAMEKEMMRACCLNPVNARGHDVLGGVTGGFEVLLLLQAIECTYMTWRGRAKEL